MSSKLATYIVLILAIILAIFYWQSAASIKTGMLQTTLGPGYFPTLLAIILIILSVISLIQTYFKKDTSKIEIPNFKLVLITLFVTILFFLSWYYIGAFFINLFLFLVILFTVYRFNEFSRKMMMKNGLIGLLITVSVYIIFDLLLNINF